MNAAFLLIALGFGYKIFAEATEKSKKSLKQLGRFVGVTIMIISIIGIACTVACAAKCAKKDCEGNKECGIHAYGKCGSAHEKKSFDGSMGKKMMCPITGKLLEKDSETSEELK